MNKSISIHLQPLFLTSDCCIFPCPDFVQLLVYCSVCLKVPETTLKNMLQLFWGMGIFCAKLIRLYYRSQITQNCNKCNK